MSVTDADRDLATQCVPAAAIFAETAEHLADMRRRAAEHIARQRLADASHPCDSSVARAALQRIAEYQPLRNGDDPYGQIAEFAKRTAREVLKSCPVEDQAFADVAAERTRQREKLGWTPEHDDGHDRDNALARAAVCYALAGTGGNGPFWITHLQTPQQVWPHDWEWKPKDRRTNLVRAAALLVAEIERFDRAALPSPTGDAQ